MIVTAGCAASWWLPVLCVCFGLAKVLVTGRAARGGSRVGGRGSGRPALLSKYTARLFFFGPRDPDLADRGAKAAALAGSRPWFISWAAIVAFCDFFAGGFVECRSTNGCR